MADAAIALLRDVERLGEMRDAARHTAQKRFCASLVIPQYVRFYESFLNAATRPAESRRRFLYADREAKRLSIILLTSATAASSVLAVFLSVMTPDSGGRENARGSSAMAMHFSGR